jgi:hypothetical protein
VSVPASSNSLWAACAATVDGEQIREAGEDQEDSAVEDEEDEEEGDYGGASLNVLP